MKKLFTVFLSLFLILSVFSCSASTNSHWSGTWYAVDGYSHIEIYDVNSKGFTFFLRAYTHTKSTDLMDEYAYFTENNNALYNSDRPIKGNKLHFNFNENYIEIKESENFNGYSVSFTGIYKREIPENWIYKKTTCISRLKRLYFFILLHR